MKNNISSLKVLNGFASFGLLISLIALVFTLSTPNQAGRSVIFGFSLARLAVAFLFMGSIAAFTWLVLGLRREKFQKKALGWIDRLVDSEEISFAVSIAILMTSIASVLFVYLLYLTRGTPYRHFYDRLIPLAGWLTVLSLLSGAAWLLLQRRLPRLNLKTIACMALIIIVGIAVYLALRDQRTAYFQDVFFNHREGQRILNGINPYARVLHGDMLHNEKYATLFPLFYELSAGVQMLGLHDFDLWIEFWKFVFLLAYLGIALIIFQAPHKRGLTTLGLFGAFFVLLNRWSLDLIVITDIDFIPIFLLVASIVLIPKHRVLSYLLFGLSLAIKQVAIFMLPVYLIWAWQASGRRFTRLFLRDVILIGLIPILSSLPFLIWNWEGFIKSILFSTTRISIASRGVLSLDALLGWSGILAKLPMLVLLLFIYILVWQKKLKPGLTALLILVVFAGLNSVSYPSYLAWTMPFIPLAANELAILIRERPIDQAAPGT